MSYIVYTRNQSANRFDELHIKHSSGILASKKEKGKGEKKERKEKKIDVIRTFIDRSVVEIRSSYIIKIM